MTLQILLAMSTVARPVSKRVRIITVRNGSVIEARNLDLSRQSAYQLLLLSVVDSHALSRTARLFARMMAAMQR